MLDRLLGLFSRDIGIDLGTANTLVHVRDRGIVMSEPSVVAIDAKSKRVLAIGAEAKRMVGRTPANIIAVRPLRDGVISDFDVTEQMIKYFVNRVHDRIGLIPRPRMLLGIPSGVTEVEKRAVRDAALNAGARWARLIEEPMAAAIGAGLPVSEPSGSLIVDIGGGTTEVAVISLGGIVVSRSIRIGGDELDQDIIAYSRREYNLLLGERTSEDIKIAIGSAYPGDYDEQTVTLRGRDLLTGLPRAVEISAEQVREAIEASVQQIVDTIKDNFYKPVNEDKLDDASLKGIVDALDDQYSHYLTPDEAKQFQESVSGEFEGVGMNVEEARRGLKVIRVFDGSPARKAGIGEGDFILAVNGRSIAGVNSEVATGRIKGPSGTSVSANTTSSASSSSDQSRSDSSSMPPLARAAGR